MRGNDPNHRHGSTVRCSRGSSPVRQTEAKRTDMGRSSRHFVFNCRCSSVILVKPGKGWAVESETGNQLSVFFYVKIHRSFSHVGWMDLLPICAIVTSFTGCLENTGSMSFAGLPNPDTTHFKRSKMCLY